MIITKKQIILGKALQRESEKVFTVKRVICPNCYQISVKNEIDFFVDIPEEKEILKFIKGVKIDGLEYCAVCR
jgi:hypothetical protein